MHFWCSDLAWVKKCYRCSLYIFHLSGCALFLLACIHPGMSCRAGWIFHPSISSGSFSSSKQAASCMRTRIMRAHLFYLGIDDFGLGEWSPSNNKQQTNNVPICLRGQYQSQHDVKLTMTKGLKFSLRWRIVQKDAAENNNKKIAKSSLIGRTFLLSI